MGNFSSYAPLRQPILAKANLSGVIQLPTFCAVRGSVEWSRLAEAVLRYLDRMQPLALLVLRLALGAVMVAHGYQKVHGHLHEFSATVRSLGLPAWLGYVSAFTEFLGGILVVLGLFTRAAAFAIAIDMYVAIAKVHWKHGLVGAGGYEFPLALAAIAFALIFFGAGPIALDAVRSGGGGSFVASRPANRRKAA